jgi:hypothetical protein
MNNPFVGFVPWIIFWVVASPSTWEYATLGALLASLILAYPSAEQHKLKLLDVVSILFFAVLSVLAVFLDPADLDWLEDYSQAISSGALALAVLGSLAYIPFTEQYARETTPREIWETPRFKQVNRMLTLVWGLVFLVSAVLGVIAQEVDSGSDWLNWIIPIVLIVGAFKFSAWYPEQVREREGGQPPSANVSSSRASM